MSLQSKCSAKQEMCHGIINRKKNIGLLHHVLSRDPYDKPDAGSRVGVGKDAVAGCGDCLGLPVKLHLPNTPQSDILI